MTMTSDEVNSRTVLNPTLYRLLMQQYHGNVEVVHPGEAMVSKVQTRHILGRDGVSQVRKSREIYDSGEEYKINCPFCNDTRMRLFLNHRWGVKDEETGSLNLWMLNCYNEGCHEVYGNQTELYGELFATKRQREAAIRLRVGTVSTTENVDAELPGPCQRLDQLQRFRPQHHAITYLQDRGYDPSYLGRKFQVSYCEQSRYYLAQDRIIIPIHMAGKMVGWQARYIGKWESGMPPKYWSMPAMKRRAMAYNFDLAVKHQTVVIVEGPVDVWGFGLQAFGVIGKSLSPQMRRLLVSRLQPGSTVVIMLDPAVDKKAKSRGQEHHIDRLYSQIWQPLREREIGLLKVFLPDGTDPGSLERAFMRDLIKTRAKEEGVRVSFTKPTGAS